MMRNSEITRQKQKDTKDNEEAQKTLSEFVVEDRLLKRSIRSYVVFRLASSMFGDDAEQRNKYVKEKGHKRHGADTKDTEETQKTQSEFTVEDRLLKRSIRSYVVFIHRRCLRRCERAK